VQFCEKGFPDAGSVVGSQGWVLNCNVYAGDKCVVDLADAVCGEEKEALEVFHTAEKCWSHIVSVGLFSSTV
jgi:hypothetical protein